MDARLGKSWQFHRFFPSIDADSWFAASIMRELVGWARFPLRAGWLALVTPRGSASPILLQLEGEVSTRGE